MQAHRIAKLSLNSKVHSKVIPRYGTGVDLVCPSGVVTSQLDAVGKYHLAGATGVVHHCVYAWVFLGSTPEGSCLAGQTKADCRPRHHEPSGL